MEISLEYLGCMSKKKWERQDCIIEALTNTELEQNTQGVRVIYLNHVGEQKSVTLNYYKNDGWKFA